MNACSGLLSQSAPETPQTLGLFEGARTAGKGKWIETKEGEGKEKGRETKGSSGRINMEGKKGKQRNFVAGDKKKSYKTYNAAHAHYSY